MSEYTKFVSMTRPEAGAYLDQFLNEMAPSLDGFAKSIDLELTFTPDSLARVWHAMLPLLAWRAGYAPPQIGQPGPQIGEAELEPALDLPSWFQHPSGAGYARFSAETLWLIDGASRYLGEILVRQAGGRWESGNVQIVGYMFQNQPVVTGVTADPVSPTQTCAVLVAKALRSGTSSRPSCLVDVYDRWCAQTG